MFRKISNKQIALLGILGAQALALSFMENLIPALPGLPPGAKPGFSNIVTMYTAAELGLGQALVITALKAVFAGITRGPTAFFMSLSGGLLSTLVMYGQMILKKQPFGITGIAVAAAIAHNLGQLIVAMGLTGTPAIINYAPLLLLFAIVTGLITGTVLRIIMPALKKQSQFFKD